MRIIPRHCLATLLAFAALPAWPQVCDVDSDDDIDRLDIQAIMAARNTPAAANDPRDQNGDGLITANDARACAIRCTLPRCAIVDPPDNTPPLADAGDDQAVFPGQTVVLDGTGSSDADGDSLTFSWTLITAPAESTATFDDPTVSTPSFTVDASGVFVFELVVNDGSENSSPDTVQVTTRVVDYEFDLNNQQIENLDTAGGSVALTDAFGRQFQIEVPPGEVDQDTEFALTAVASVSGLPDGLLPVAAVRMEPAGLEFLRPVRLTFELLPSDRNGPWIALVSDDDGDRLFLKTLRGTTPRSAALEELVVGIDLNHFSTAVIAEVEPGADIPPVPPRSDAQERAIHIIEERVAELLQVIELLGEPDSDDISLIDDPIITLALLDWLQDIQVRLDDLAVTPNIDDLGSLQDLLFESVELILEAGQYLGEEIDGQFDVLEEAVIAQLAETIASYFLTARDRCATDSLGAQSILDSLEEDILEQFTSSDLTDLFEDEVFDCRYFVTFSPSFQAEFVGGSVDIQFVITLEDGTPFDGGPNATGAGSSLSLDNLTLISESEDTIVVGSAAGLFGLGSVTLEIGAGPPATAEVLILPNLVGSYGASGTGTASGCSDPDDEGPGGGAEGIDFITQSILSANRGQAIIGIAGVGTIVTGIDLTVTLTNIGRDVATGSAFGGASYRLVEVEDDETFVTIGSGSLDGSVTATDSGNTFLLEFNGGDNFCSSVTGTVLMASP